MAGSPRPEVQARRLAGICSPLGLAGALAAFAAVAFFASTAFQSPTDPAIGVARIITLSFLLFGLRGSTVLLAGQSERPLAELALLSAIVGAAALASSAGGAAGATLLFGLAPLLHGLGYSVERRDPMLGATGVVAGLFAIIAHIIANEDVRHMAVGAALVWMLLANIAALRASLSRSAPKVARIEKPAEAQAKAPAPVVAAMRPQTPRHSGLDTARHAALLVMVGFSGWVIGSFYPIPHATSEDVAGPSVEASAPADGGSKSSATPAPMAAAPTATAQFDGFERVLLICPQMRITNPPPADAERRVLNYSPVVSVSGVAIAPYPTRDACLSSGFGQRGGSPHSGIDYYGRIGLPIMAAGDGVILEHRYHPDFGNMVVIDHGNGVYTRYAHMNAFEPGLDVGSRVHAGQVIGAMGRTGDAQAVHLHYEVLTGDYANPRASFGLQPRNPLAPSA